MIFTDIKLIYISSILHQNNTITCKTYKYAAIVGKHWSSKQLSVEWSMEQSKYNHFSI